MAKGKISFQPEHFESTSKRSKKSDNYARIYRSMLFHPAFTTLKHRQKILYVYCKDKNFGARRPRSDYPEIPVLADEKMFYMPFNDAVEAGLYTKNMRHEFYSDMQALEEHGLIITVASGKAGKHKNIYAYSDKWQEWKS